jgi:hypothetical protein
MDPVLREIIKDFAAYLHDVEMRSGGEITSEEREVLTQLNDLLTQWLDDNRRLAALRAMANGA